MGELKASAIKGVDSDVDAGEGAEGARVDVGTIATMDGVGAWMDGVGLPGAGVRVVVGAGSGVTVRLVLARGIPTVDVARSDG